MNIADHSQVRAFTGPGSEFVAEKCGHWLKALAGSSKSRDWCVSNTMPLHVKAQSEGADQYGGYLVPQELDKAILSIRDTVGAARTGDVRLATSDNKVVPRRNGAATASYVAEGAVIPESTLDFGAVEFTSKKLAILLRSSVELWDDPAPDLAEYIAQEAGWAFAAAEDDAAFNGTGTSAYGGMTGLSTALTGLQSSIAAASGRDTYLTIDQTDLGNLMGGVLATAIPNAKWYISAVGFAQCFCRLASAGSGLVQFPDGRIHYLGFPVVFSTKFPNSTGSLAGLPMMWFGNLKQSLTLAERNIGLVIATSFDRSRETFQVLVRCARRIHLISHDLGDSSTYGSLAMLTGTT